MAQLRKALNATGVQSYRLCTDKESGGSMNRDGLLALRNKVEEGGRSENTSIRRLILLNEGASNIEPFTGRCGIINEEGVHGARFYVCAGNHPMRSCEAQP